MDRDPTPLDGLGAAIAAFDRVLRLVIVAFGGLLVCSMAFLTVFNTVVMRKFANAPIRGAEDVLQLLLVATVALAIPFGARIGSHVELEILTDYTSPAATRRVLVVSRCISAVFIFLAAYQLWMAGANAGRLGEVTQQLEISFGPFYYLLSVCFFAYALVQVLDIAQLRRDGTITPMTTEGTGK